MSASSNILEQCNAFFTQMRSLQQQLKETSATSAIFLIEDSIDRCFDTEVDSLITGAAKEFMIRKNTQAVDQEWIAVEDAVSRCVSALQDCSSISTRASRSGGWNVALEEQLTQNWKGLGGDLYRLALGLRMAPDDIIPIIELRKKPENRTPPGSSISQVAEKPNKLRKKILKQTTGDTNSGHWSIDSWRSLLRRRRNPKTPATLPVTPVTTGATAVPAAKVARTISGVRSDVGQGPSNTLSRPSPSVTGPRGDFSQRNAVNKGNKSQTALSTYSVVSPAPPPYKTKKEEEAEEEAETIVRDAIETPQAGPRYRDNKLSAARSTPVLTATNLYVQNLHLHAAPEADFRSKSSGSEDRGIRRFPIHRPQYSAPGPFPYVSSHPYQNHAAPPPPPPRPPPGPYFNYGTAPMQPQWPAMAYQNNPFSFREALVDGFMDLLKPEATCYHGVRHTQVHPRCPWGCCNQNGCM